MPQGLPLVESPKGRSLPPDLEIHCWRFWSPLHSGQDPRACLVPIPGMPRPRPTRSHPRHSLSRYHLEKQN